MKGKSQFKPTEIKAIQQLIMQKLNASTTEQKSIRAKIRRLGFYASDFGLRGGYTVFDFNNAIKGKIVINNKAKFTKPLKLKTKQNDESYIIDLCDEVLKLKGSRQHRFDFLRGDTGVKLPVDVYYPSLNMVIEYYERQHTETVKFFDKRITASGISRGEQRKHYDEWRKVELPKNGINLIVFDYSEFEHTSNKRLVRDNIKNLEIIKRKLA
jgi:hypothetical protein